jgi:glycosyltransferase involved in cell wall biosynthesis
MVTETYPPEINGVAMTIGRGVAALQARDHQVQLIRPRQAHEPAAVREDNLEQVLRPGIPIPNYAGLNMGLPAKRLLIRLWTLRRPDLVHIATEGPLGWSAMSAARKLDIPVLAGFHTNFHRYSGHYGLGWLKKPIHAYLRKFHNQARMTLVPCHDLRDELTRSGYRNVEVLARGVDTRLFAPVRRDPALRREWGVGENGLAVIHVGRLAPEKNLPLLVEAFAAIAGPRPDARLILVGDGPAVEALRRDHPTFIYRGSRSGEDLAAHYASADLFLFPSLTETFGNVLLEAMASGLAVLAYDRAAAAEHIRSGDNGLTVPPGEEIDFVFQAAWLARNPWAIHAFGRRARATTLPISWDGIFDRLEGYYRQVVREREAVQEVVLRKLGLDTET